MSDLTKFSTLRSALAVPLQGVDGIVGVLAIYRAEKDAFSREDLRILLAVGSKLGMSLENALLYHTVERSATTDYMTNLPNARSLFMRLRKRRSTSPRSSHTSSNGNCLLVPFPLLLDDKVCYRLVNPGRGRTTF